MATKSWLNQHGHQYSEKNVTQDRSYASELVSLGYRVTPVTVVDGTAVVGFSPNKLSELFIFLKLPKN